MCPHKFSERFASRTTIILSNTRNSIVRYKGRIATIPKECKVSCTPKKNGSSNKIVSRVKKTSLGESLAGSHAYNLIRDSRRDTWRDFLVRKVSPTVSPKVSPRVSARLSTRLLASLSARLLARLFALKSLAKGLAESLGSDYMHDSRRDSLRDSFFLHGLFDGIWLISQNILVKSTKFLFS